MCHEKWIEQMWNNYSFIYCRILFFVYTQIHGGSLVCPSKKKLTLKWRLARNGSSRMPCCTAKHSGRHLLEWNRMDVFGELCWEERLLSSMEKLVLLWGRVFILCKNHRSQIIIQQLFLSKHAVMLIWIFQLTESSNIFTFSACLTENYRCIVNEIKLHFLTNILDITNSKFWNFNRP